MTFTISADDPKTIRAIEIAAEADHWLKGHDADGDEVFAVPSQADPARYYIVTLSSCDCPDFVHSNAAAPGQPGSSVCKHMLAVRLHTELARAQEQEQRDRARRTTPPRRRGHLTLI
ncbi:MAG TPA: hypothetical protein VGL99_23220 [Chloroflexota bacterium]